MGIININIRGSFAPNAEKFFSAMQHGHADAVAKAIAWLSNDVLPRAIRLDHKLQADAMTPEGPWGRDPK